VLSTLQESEIPVLLKNLDLETCDVLMKYVYKLMAKTSNCATMLKIHAQLVEKAGLGSIVRVMTDRKQV
jgi:actin related protein 2/3 complex subunit 5